MSAAQEAPDQAPGRTDIATRALLISIQPRFANAILSGTKTIELRRTMPTLPPGATALIYASTPIKALVGWVTVEEILREEPETLWEKHRLSTGVTSREFRDYFAGRDQAFGLRLTTVTRAQHALSLTSLRAHGLEPPQSWRYVPSETAKLLRAEMQQTTRHRSPLWPPSRLLEHVLSAR